jgi:hypothetical protein
MDWMIASKLIIWEPFIFRLVAFRHPNTPLTISMSYKFSMIWSFRGWSMA